MRFSIIIPVYNVEKYISQCVESILAQTFTDFELILVDDGSKDNSAVLCDSFHEKDSRVLVIHKRNGGQADARNVGTRDAKGEYIIYIDSDDFIITNDFLQKIDIACQSKADIVFYKHKKFFDNSKQLGSCTYSYAEAIKESAYDRMVYCLVEKDAFFGMPWNKAIRRDLIQKNGIYFETGLVGEDMEWIFHLVTNAGSVVLVDEPFVAYRQREGSTTTSLRIKNIADFVYILEKWSANVKILKNEVLRKALLGSLAKYYSNLLVAYSRVYDDNKRDYESKIKELSWLLKYGLSKRPKTIRKVYCMCGFSVTILFLTVLDKIKN